MSLLEIRTCRAMEQKMVPSFDIELLRSYLFRMKNFENDIKQVHISSLKKFDELVKGAYLSKGTTVNEDFTETTVIDQQRTLVDVTNTSRTLRSKHTAEPSSSKDILNTPLPVPTNVEPSKPSRKRLSSLIEINEPDPIPINLNMPSTSRAEYVPNHTAVVTVSEQAPERDTLIVELPKSPKKKVGAMQKPISLQILKAKRPCTPSTNLLVSKESSSSKLAVKHNIRLIVNKCDNETYKKNLKDCQAKKYLAIKAKTEALKKKNEDKLKKAHALRDAAEKEKLAQLAKLEMEKKMKAKQLLDEKEKQKEEILIRKKLHQQKAQEAEERRLKEEAARLAKLQEQEKEHKRLEEQRIKEQQAAEKLKAQRKLQEEKRMKELNSKKEQFKSEPIYDDNAEVEKNRNTLVWSRDQMDAVLMRHSIYDSELVQNYFGCKEETPNLKKYFGKYALSRVRTSSASWNTTAQYLENEKQN